MAIFHLSVKNHTREVVTSSKKSYSPSIIAKIAYRATMALTDNETNITYDFTKKARAIFSEMFLPAHAPSAYADRMALWTAVQKAETDKNARLAREFEISIPNELTQDEGIELVKNFAKSLTADGMCADVNIHWVKDNHHAHIMCTTRLLDENGKWQQKSKTVYALDENGQKIPILDENGQQKIGARGRKLWKRETEINPLDRTENVEKWRSEWEALANAALTKYHERISRKSLYEQGLVPRPLPKSATNTTRARKEIAKRNDQATVAEIFADAKQNFIDHATHDLYQDFWEFVREGVSYVRETIYGKFSDFMGAEGDRHHENQPMRYMPMGDFINNGIKYGTPASDHNLREIKADNGSERKLGHRLLQSVQIALGFKRLAWQMLKFEPLKALKVVKMRAIKEFSGFVGIDENTFRTQHVPRIKAIPKAVLKATLEPVPNLAFTDLDQEIAWTDALQESERREPKAKLSKSFDELMNEKLKEKENGRKGNHKGR